MAESISFETARVTLRPTAVEAEAAWAALVVANREQAERVREWQDPPDFYAPISASFRADPGRSDDPALNALLALATPGDTWLDVGAGGGRFCLGVARRVARMIAVEPSEAMRGVLAESATAGGVRNVETVVAHWPMPDPPRADVAMFTHVGYDIAEIGAFVDGLEAAARRLCVTQMMERQPGAPFAKLFAAVHGEPRAELPTLREFVTLLFARGRYPTLAFVAQRPWGFASLDEARRAAGRWLWLAEGSPKYNEMAERLPAFVTVAPDGSVLPRLAAAAVGMVTWAPREGSTAGAGREGG